MEDLEKLVARLMAETSEGIEAIRELVEGRMKARSFDPVALLAALRAYERLARKALLMGAPEDVKGMVETVIEAVASKFEGSILPRVEARMRDDALSPEVRAQCEQHLAGVIEAELGFATGRIKVYSGGIPGLPHKTALTIKGDPALTHVEEMRVNELMEKLNPIRENLSPGGDA